MNRTEFKSLFNSPEVVVLPVIHVLDNEQAERNIAIAVEAGCPGIFLINHDFHYEQFLPIIKHVRQRFPSYWIGVNFLSVTGKTAFPILAELGREGVKIDAYWADDARIDEMSTADQQPEANEISATRVDCGWDGIYFGGTAFKKQREVLVEGYSDSAKIATQFMDVVTTSGIATGHSAELEKINTFRHACGEHSLAVASGITPENISQYAASVDAVLVATGINIEKDFYNIDPGRLALLLEQCRS